MRHKWIGILLAVLLIVFALWDTAISKWVIVAIGAFMLIKILFLKRSGAVKPVAKAKKK